MNCTKYPLIMPISELRHTYGLEPAPWHVRHYAKVNRALRLYVSQQTNNDVVQTNVTRL